ncbi:MAG: hypothetical protein U0229_05690 [Anaeromyxobacter sp.]
MPFPTLALALALAQPAPPVPPEALAPRPVPGGAPLLRWGAPTSCLVRSDGSRARAQCDRATLTCLVAPDAELDPAGAPRGPLERAPACGGPELREEALAADGFRLAPAAAEIAPGWRRDERQRAMQVAFDLDRRLWLGAGYTAGNAPAAGPTATFGIRWDQPSEAGGVRTVLRWRALETRASFDGHLADVLVASVDMSRTHPNPLLRITTLVGTPRRFDLDFDAGWFVELARLESIRTDAGNWYDREAFGPAALTLDLWRSPDLASYVRLRAGAGYEVAEQLRGGAFTPGGGLDLELGLDRAGLHHLRATVLGEAVVPEEKGAFQPKDEARPPLKERRRRLTGTAQYEVVLLAVNDQPLSLVLEARAWQRDDVPGYPTGWRFEATSWLRFNLGAPAPRGAPAQDRL